MILKRLAAFALAVALIAGAWVIRDRIDGDTADADEPANAGLIVCATEFMQVCRTVVDDQYLVVSESASDTLDRLASTTAEPVLWLTFDPFPAMMNARRSAAAAPPFEWSATDLASSRIAVVVRRDTTAEIAGACGDPIDLACVGEQVSLKPAVSPVDTGLGLLAISAAFAARADDPIDLTDVDLLSWARSFRRASDSVQLSGGTAVQTIQTRTTVSVALGVEAELSATRRDDFDVLYPATVARAKVVLMKPAGFDIPDDLVAGLRAELETRGWDAPAASDPGAIPSATSMIGIGQFWEDLA